MRTVVFFNGPVQNGTFTFHENPGKGVGISIAAALNELMGTPPTPHLWNTVTLAGDLRFRGSLDRSRSSRRDTEARLIAHKYDTLDTPSFVTDADPFVAETALRVIESGLVSGELTIREETVPVCAYCGHMTGHTAPACRACGSTTTRPRAGKHLVAIRDPLLPVLGRRDIHQAARRQPAHLQHTADQVPARLLLSRTRDYGISLDPFGLTGLVLDPRTGLHATVLAAARAAHAEQAVMIVTGNALINIAAYGLAFRNIDGIRLQYSLHGRIPFSDLDPKSDPLITRWFLPLASLDYKSGISTVQLPALLRHLVRTMNASPAKPDPIPLAEIRSRITQGDTKWVAIRHLLAHALALHRDTVMPRATRS